MKFSKIFANNITFTFKWKLKYFPRLASEIIPHISNVGTIKMFCWKKISFLPISPSYLYTSSCVTRGVFSDANTLDVSGNFSNLGVMRFDAKIAKLDDIKRNMLMNCIWKVLLMYLEIEINFFSEIEMFLHTTQSYDDPISINPGMFSVF